MGFKGGIHFTDMFSLCLNKTNCDIFVLYNDLWVHVFITAEKESNINFIFAYLNSAAVVAKKNHICGAKMHAAFNNNFFTHFTKKQITNILFGPVGFYIYY